MELIFDFREERERERERDENKKGMKIQKGGGAPGCN